MSEVQGKIANWWFQMPLLLIYLLRYYFYTICIELLDQYFEPRTTAPLHDRFPEDTCYPRRTATRTLDTSCIVSHPVGPKFARLRPFCSSCPSLCDWPSNWSSFPRPSCLSDVCPFLTPRNLFSCPCIKTGFYFDCRDTGHPTFVLLQLSIEEVKGLRPCTGYRVLYFKKTVSITILRPLFAVLYSRYGIMDIFYRIKVGIVNVIVFTTLTMRLIVKSILELA